MNKSCDYPWVRPFLLSVILKTTNQIRTLDDHGVVVNNAITLFLLPTEHKYVC